MQQLKKTNKKTEIKKYKLLVIKLVTAVMYSIRNRADHNYNIVTI